MADDKPTLTRRRVLGGIATIGVAGALGASTWAEYSDEETAQLTVEAGTLNLTIDGQDGNKAKVQVGPIEPADSNPEGNIFSESFTLKNTGNRPGNSQELRIEQLFSEEGATPESETDTATSNGGELEDQLEIRAYVTNGAAQEYYFFGSSDSFVDYNSVEGQDSGRVVNALAPSEEVELVIEGRFKNSENNNAAQGDVLRFDAVVTLYQRNACLMGR